MNYTMGREIDDMMDAERDRILTATDFTDGEWGTPGCGCLITTADGCSGGLLNQLNSTRFWNAAADRGRVPWANLPAAWRFKCAVRRFGKGRVVRAIKLRAGARIEIPTETPTPAEVAP
jgi:hypothetical protein